MVSRPVGLGRCRLAECEESMSFNDLFRLNTWLDEWEEREALKMQQNPLGL